MGEDKRQFEPGWSEAMELFDDLGDLSNAAHSIGLDALGRKLSDAAEKARVIAIIVREAGSK